MGRVLRTIRNVTFVVLMFAAVFTAKRTVYAAECWGFNNDNCSGCYADQIGFQVYLDYYGCTSASCGSTCQSWCQSLDCIYYGDYCTDEDGYIDGSCFCVNCA
jgi:hypothetical protein